MKKIIKEIVWFITSRIIGIFIKCIYCLVGRIVEVEEVEVVKGSNDGK